MTKLIKYYKLIWQHDEYALFIIHILFLSSLGLLIYDVNIITVIVNVILTIFLISYIFLLVSAIKAEEERKYTEYIFNTVIEYTRSIRVYTNNVEIMNNRIYPLDIQTVYISKDAYSILGHNRLIYGVNFVIDPNRKGAEIGLTLKQDVINNVNNFFYE